jgi:CheY-like chemotaxis protein
MKADQRLAAVPILMFTAHAEDERIEEAKSAGVDAYIVKGRLDWVALRTELLRLIGPGKPALRQPLFKNDNSRATHKDCL